MKKRNLAQWLVAVGSLTLASCSITPEAAAPAATKQSADNVAPICPDGDCSPSGGGGTGDDGTTCAAPTSFIVARIRREAFLYAYGMNWTPQRVIVGIEGCNGIYPFSLEFIRNRDGRALWVGGRYDANSGSIDMDYIEP